MKVTPDITRQQIAEQIGITLNGVKYHIANLKKAGRLKMQGKTSDRRWIIIEPQE